MFKIRKKEEKKIKIKLTEYQLKAILHWYNNSLENSEVWCEEYIELYRHLKEKLEFYNN